MRYRTTVMLIALVLLTIVLAAQELGLNDGGGLF